MPIEHWSIKDAQNMKNTRFMYFACNTAWTWDVIISISDEVEVFLGRRITSVDVVYISSRLITGLTICATIPFITLPLTDCSTMVHMMAWLGGASGSLTTLLFLFRANSVYHDSAPAKILFRCMWVVATVAHLIFPLSFSSQPVQPDALCVVDLVKKHWVLFLSAVVMFDWAVFWSISFRVIQFYSPETHWQKKCRMFITGVGTNTLPRALIRTGYLYILPLLCFQVCVAWLEFSTSPAPPASYQYQAVFLLAAGVVNNSMACRVFRLLRQLKVEKGITQLGHISAPCCRQDTVERAAT